MVNTMAMESGKLKIELSIEVNGKKGNNMETANKHGQMEKCTMESGKKVNFKVKKLIDSLGLMWVH